jgi:hypothetical protein
MARQQVLWLHWQIEALHSDKRALAKVLQQRDTELDDVHSRLRQSLVRLCIVLSACGSLAVEPCVALCRHAQTVWCGDSKFLWGWGVQDKVVALSDTNAALDADAHEARAGRSRLQQELAKVQQQAEVLEGHNKWLAQELAARTEAALQERRAVSAQVSCSACKRYPQAVTLLLAG